MKHTAMVNKYILYSYIYYPCKLILLVILYSFNFFSFPFQEQLPLGKKAFRHTDIRKKDIREFRFGKNTVNP